MSSYLIELKQGTRFVTSNYWKDGNHIRFYFHGGIVGIHKRHIERISKTTPENTAEDQKTTGRENTQHGVENNTVMEEEAVPILEPDYKITTILEAKRYLMSEMKSLITDIKKAKTENNKKVIQEQRKRLLSLHAELQDLRNIAKKENGGKIPDWWHTPDPNPPDPLQ